MNPHKSGKYLCHRFAERQTSSLDFDIDQLFAPSEQTIILPNKINHDGDHSDLDKIKINNQDDLNALLDKITREFSSGLPRDLKIDDGDLPLAKNFIDFNFNPVFVGRNDPQYPFPKQIEIALHLYSDYCPYCSDLTFIHNIPVAASIDQILERTQLLEWGKCPKCQKTRLDIWADTTIKTKRYTDLIGIAGQRSGKTAGVNRLNAYQAHRMFKLSRPQKVFGTEESVWFESSFTATTFAKAVDNFYDPLVYQFKNNPWYKQYHSMLDFYGQKHGEQLYKILGETTYYRHRNYQFYPQSPDPANMRGATRYFVDVDELAHLYAQSDTAKKLNPKELHTSLRNSLFTLRNAYNRLVQKGFYDLPPVMMCNITSPRSMNDFAMKLFNDAENEKSSTFSFHYSVYQMNPHVAEDDPELLEIKRTDPEGFKRDYLAIPPSAHNAFVDNKEIIKACIKKGHVNAINMTPTYLKGQAKNIKQISATYQEREGKKINKHSNKILCIDAGSTNNAFGLVVGHLEEHFPYEDPDIKEYTKVIDIVAEITPKDGRIISFPDVYDNVIAPIIDDFNVILIGADRWNSLGILQKASDDFDIPYMQYSLKFKDFERWKGALYSHDFWMPMAEGITIDQAFNLASSNYPFCFEGKPVAHAFFQMLTVENLMNRKVEKGGSFTDDIFRALVLCDYFLSKDDLREDLIAPREAQTDNSQFVGVVAGSSGITAVGGVTVSSSGTQSSVGALSSQLPWGRN